MVKAGAFAADRWGDEQAERYLPRADNLFQLITSAILKGPANKNLKKATG